VNIFVIPVAALMLAGTSAVAAQQAKSAEPTTEPAEPSEELDEIDRLYNEYQASLYAHQFEKALVAAEAIKLEPDNRLGNAIVASMRASALFGLKRDKDAQQAVARAEQLAPREPEVITTLFIGGLGIGRADVAADALDRLIAIAPDKVRELDSKLVWQFLRNEPEGQQRKNDDRRVALAQLGYGGTDGDELTSVAIGILLERGNIAAATELLHYLNDPVSVEQMLLQKRYAALWPALETLAGPHMEKVAESALSEAQREYADDPDNSKKASAVVNALIGTGQVEQAIAMRSKIPTSPEEMATADEDMGWLVDSVADAYLAAERGDEADELYALLNDAKIENGWWRVSMRINRLGALVKTGKLDRAVALFETTEASAKSDGNDYARQLVRRLKFCTFSRLGRKDEAAAVLTDLLDHAGDAPGPTLDALLCGGQFDEAEKLVLSRPTKVRFELQFVITLQTKPSSLSAPPIWQSERLQFRQRPAIAAEFDRLGRDLPEQFMPAPRQVAAN